MNREKDRDRNQPFRTTCIHGAVKWAAEFLFNVADFDSYKIYLTLYINHKRNYR